MAPKVVWTHQALMGLENVLGYLEEKWTTKEIFQLKLKVEEVLRQVQNQPELFPGSIKFKGLRRAVVDKNNYLIYKWNSTEHIILIINFRGTKQRPLY